MTKEHYDLVVLGAGPGGYVAAIRAAQLGKKVAVVEKQYWGGVCLNVGCIPSKALLKNAEVAHTFNHEAKDFGISGDVSFDFPTAHKRSRKVSKKIVGGIHYLMKKNKIQEINGLGHFKDAKTIEVKEGDDEGKTLTFDDCIIATGSVVKTLPGIELGGNIVSYEEQILDENAPESIVIVGAGAIGMEFAYVLANYGVDVTVVEFMDRVLPNEDADVSKEIAKQYKKLGVKLLTSYKTTSVKDNGDNVTVEVESKDGKKQDTLTVDRCLVAVGFAPRVEGYGLENTGVELTERGAIAIDERMRTNVDGIYAIGDVTAKLQLAHVAEAQGVVAAETIGGVETQELGDYQMMPRATFCNPQVASFGYTEEAAKEKWPDRDIKVATFPFSANGKALGLNESAGFTKLIADGEFGELLGAHLVGSNVSELLPQLTLAQRFDLTAGEIARNVHTHPTLSEGMKETAHGVADGHMINL
ncbi:dihydrolipoyl dehydrogenase [Corynebacterium pseudodiphtheriticum]|uniref:Dihydrolipoyl dehydrogenase n=1 Tax=Corynebacterium pseudodiphtheriticum TaxID=37637 RepID=A0ABT7FV27_9CORY|nr:dihydrolipoyl dehydrogenase [Corynebacterium pseudodiphtheriticum]ERJ45488.2 dihydrolipoyl dehydrogenase [Corynebacterium pseudodiphtheriticum 090104]OBA54424.1 dihydrolipoyl dehydrogenase [Corynebacterium sp. EPI-003-04-2554_SCH2473622]MCT1666808.1 dihydrolipoyl dehydrogenase [Corynebacterium pseudodiphtheriticum]MDC7083967.1 dihydrolipoyl dehydrogenase [Corynebacterium pseudodiphtheriticum]MDC7112636.1 dihydrolipoyl dehydrogenase [Corynebacterium pseudodiphtheriticum]